MFTEKLFEPARVSELVGFMRSNPFPTRTDGFAGQATACLDHDTCSQLGRIDLPTLVPVGDEDALLTVQASEQLASVIPGARLAALQGSGDDGSRDAVLGLVRFRVHGSRVGSDYGRPD